MHIFSVLSSFFFLFGVVSISPSPLLKSKRHKNLASFRPCGFFWASQTFWSLESQDSCLPPLFIKLAVVWGGEGRLPVRWVGMLKTPEPQLCLPLSVGQPAFPSLFLPATCPRPSATEFIKCWRSQTSEPIIANILQLHSDCRLGFLQAQRTMAQGSNSPHKRGANS